jgi:hypothetical protein
MEGLTLDTEFSTMGMTFDGDEPAKLKVNKKARYCECGTKLSMYNLESACYRHQTN